MPSNTVIRSAGRATRVACTMLMALALCAGALAAEKKATEKHWYKGNIHCHTVWSDGNSFPEWVVDWYKNRGFQFVALTDHNTFQEGEKWVLVAPKKGKGQAMQEAYDKYKDKFAAQVVEQTSGSQTLVRLKTFDQLSQQFNEPGKFLMIPGEEITTHGPRGTNYRVHTVAMNLAEKIKEPSANEGRKNAGTELANTMARQINRQRESTGRAIHGHLNHPLWSHMKLEDILTVRGFNQMEINNEAPADLPRIEKIWDLVIADRIKNKKPLMLGVAVDDAHNHMMSNGAPSTEAGNGWVVVRAESLTAENIVKAIDAGNFYSSSGPELLDIRREKQRLALRIKPEEGVTYKTDFIGMREGGQPGELLATSSALNPVYQIRGDEHYVRAKVTSSKEWRNSKGEMEFYATAWTQPYQPKKAQ